ncbi:MAG: putative lipid II flippase FtsW, partial [Gammaproteobacteria bacterium]|nr:putative lipid II flippase FtsW [Gammaproteobacteria bacterium]
MPFHFLLRQGMYLLLGFLIACIVIRTSIATWQQYGIFLLLIGLVLLVAVLIPGLGRQVNGSSRWIGFGPLQLQVSEFVKLAMVLYLSSYLVRHHQEVRSTLEGLIRPLIVLGVLALLLLLEPDYGATAVLVVTVVGMMFLAGMRLKIFLMFSLAMLTVMAILAISSPYRVLRLTSFLNPWAHQYSSGYQLTQSLIAFGRGGLFGVGLGGSIQKLFYLPEAHTDFLFAVLAEELGLLGVLAMIGLYIVFIWRIFFIGRRAQLADMHGAGYMAYGFGLWFSMQIIVNIGVNAGLLPTKGLTLPLFSYGGSSILIVAIVVALLLRIDYETNRREKNVHRLLDW